MCNFVVAMLLNFLFRPLVNALGRFQQNISRTEQTERLIGLCFFFLAHKRLR